MLLVGSSLGLREGHVAATLECARICGWDLHKGELKATCCTV